MSLSVGQDMHPFHSPPYPLALAHIFASRVCVCVWVCECLSSARKHKQKFMARHRSFVEKMKPLWERPSDWAMTGERWAVRFGEQTHISRSGRIFRVKGCQGRLDAIYYKPVHGEKAIKTSVWHGQMGFNNCTIFRGLIQFDGLTRTKSNQKEKIKRFKDYYLILISSIMARRFASEKGN